MFGMKMKGFICQRIMGKSIDKNVGHKQSWAHFESSGCIYENCNVTLQKGHLICVFPRERIELV